MMMPEDTKTDSMPSKPVAFGALGMSAIASAMLLWAIFGSPPYAYFGILKLAVAGTCAYLAYVGFNASRAFAPLTLALICVGGIHLFGKMHRQDWMLFNWIGIVSLIISATVLAIMAWRKGKDLNE
jgi:glucose uptake protein GlcU